MDHFKTFIQKESFKELRSLKRLTEPLLTVFGITTFWHHYIDAKGSYFYLGNDPEAMEGYLELNLHQTCPFFTHPRNIPEICLFEDNLTDIHYQRERENLRKKTKLQNHYVIFRKPSPDICECFGFASTNSLNAILDTVVQSRDLFDSFIDHYLANTPKLRQRSYDNRVSILGIRKDAFLQKTSFHQLLQQGSKKRLIFLSSLVPANEMLKNLTNREIECIRYYLKGLTAEETGVALHISKRTVESHFEHIKNNLNIDSKRSLFSLANHLI